MKIEFNEKNLDLFNEGEELYKPFIALFVHLAEENKIDRELVDELAYIHDLFIDLKKSFVCSIIEKSIQNAED